MKKRILLIISLLLFATGCTCEYNLTIENNTYKEEITLTGETSEETSNFNNKWNIPVDIDEHNKPGDPESNIDFEGDVYKYNLNGNTIKFNYDFTKNEYSKSTAVLNCYNKLTVSNYENSIVISTSSKAECFDKYPPLTSIKVNIKTNKKVTSNNADSINGNIYTWNITKENANNKPINLVLENQELNKDNGGQNLPNNNLSKKEKKSDYIMYIFLGILLVVMLSVYFIINKIKNKSDNMDD